VLTVAPRGSPLGSVLLSLNSVWFSSHFSHLPTEQTGVDPIRVLILCFKFMMRANIILVHLRGGVLLTYIFVHATVCVRS